MRYTRTRERGRERPETVYNMRMKNKNLVFCRNIFRNGNFLQPSSPLKSRLLALVLYSGCRCFTLQWWRVTQLPACVLPPIVVTCLKCIIYYETSASVVETKQQNITGHYRVFTFPTLVSPADII